LKDVIDAVRVMLGSDILLLKFNSCHPYIIENILMA